jgi:hypothetical protein
MWVRLDTAMPRNPKMLTLLNQKDGHRAANAYIFGLLYSGEQGLNGFIPREALGQLSARSADMQRLVDARLVQEIAGGWLVPDWAEYQPTSEETKQRSERAKQAAAARWSKRQAST